MAFPIVARKNSLTRDEWVIRGYEFLELRRGLAGAGPDEAVVGFIDGFKAIYIRPGQRDPGETWYCWFVDEAGGGKADRVVHQILPGTYSDAQTGQIFEWDPAWCLVLGVVSRIGGALLTAEMLRGG